MLIPLIGALVSVTGLVIEALADRQKSVQKAHYGTRADYRAYADHTPLILPLIPICHIGAYKTPASPEIVSH